MGKEKLAKTFKEPKEELLEIVNEFPPAGLGNQEGIAYAGGTDSLAYTHLFLDAFDSGFIPEGTFYRSWKSWIPSVGVSEDDYLVLYRRENPGGLKNFVYDYYVQCLTQKFVFEIGEDQHESYKTSNQHEGLRIFRRGFTDRAGHG